MDVGISVFGRCLISLSVTFYAITITKKSNLDSITFVFGFFVRFVKLIL